MNIFKELKRVERYKSLDPWLRQDGVVSVTWQHNILVDIKQLKQNKVQSVYLPTFSNGRYVEIYQLSRLEYYDRLVASYCAYSFP